MYAAAAWLAWVLAQQTGSRGPGPAARRRGVLAASALWLFGAAQQRRSLRRPRAALAPAWPAQPPGRRSAVAVIAAASPRHATAGRPPAAIAGEPWSAGQASRALRAAGRPVFVNFTAAWCVTCQVNERGAFSSAGGRATPSRRPARPISSPTGPTATPPSPRRWPTRAGSACRSISSIRKDGGAPRVLPQLLTPGVVAAALDRADAARLSPAAMSDTPRPDRSRARRAGSRIAAPTSLRAERRGDRRGLRASMSCTASSGWRPAAFEYADALGKFLPDADRPNEGVFALQDDDEQWMALRYDLTAPLARFAAENWETLPKPFRRYAVGHGLARREAGPGPLSRVHPVRRRHRRLGAAEADAEIIAMAVAGYAAAGLPRGRGQAQDQQPQAAQRPAHRRRGGDPGQKLAVLRAVDKLDRLGERGVRRPARRGRKDESGAFTKGAQLDAAGRSTRCWPFSSAGRGGRARDPRQPGQRDRRLRRGRRGARRALALSARRSTRMGVAERSGRLRSRGGARAGILHRRGVRGGADADARAAPRFGSIGGGGRYDDLVARFTGERTPATGFSFGVSRLVAALAARRGEAKAAPGPGGGARSRPRP